MKEAVHMNAAEIIRQTLSEAMADDQSIILLGQGVTDSKAVFGTLAGLPEKFPGRFVETSCSEGCWSGMAVGMGLMGLRPVMIFQRVEFGLLAVEQIVNNAAKVRFLTGKPCPVVFRMIIGRGWGQGPTHGQSFEGFWASIPGIRVVMPGTPEEAGILLKNALTGDEPVVYLEHRWLHGLEAEMWPAKAVGPILASWPGRDQDGGSPTILVAGTDITIAAAGWNVQEALRAASILRECGRSAEVISLRTLAPLDARLVLESVGRTRRFLGVDTGSIICNVATTLSGMVAYACWDVLRGPPAVLGANHHPLPSAPSLVIDYYPTVANIVTMALQMMSANEAVTRQALILIAEERNKREIDRPPVGDVGPF